MEKNPATEQPSTSQTESPSMKPFFRVILAMCALLLTWTAVAAEAEEEKEKDPFLVAMTLLLKESSEEPEGLETIRDAAENGSADAQCQLGLLYVFGFFGCRCRFRLGIRIAVGLDGRLPQF